MGFFAIVVVFCLLAAAGYYGKPWIDRRLLLHRDHPKKREEETASSCDDGGVEIVVQESTVKREVNTEDTRKPSIPVASALPARLARQQLGSPLGPMEASIRTALRELRSRQVVKTICSKFESRMASAKSGLNGDERATAESGDDNCDVRAVQYQPLLPRQETAKAAEKPQPAAARPMPRHSTGGAGPAQRSNNLNAFLRRYSSNLEKAVMATQIVTSNESDSSEDTMRDRDSEEHDAATPATVNVSIPAQPAIMTPCDADSDLDDDYDDLKLEETLNKEAESTSRMPAPLLNLQLDIEPIVAIPSDDSSNQCDSLDDNDTNDEETGEDIDKQDPVDPPEATKASDNNSNGSSSPRSRLAKWTASRIPVPAAHSLLRSNFTSESSAQKKKLQTPEKASKSVTQLQKFRQQVPANTYVGARHLD